MHALRFFPEQDLVLMLHACRDEKRPNLVEDFNFNEISNQGGTRYHAPLLEPPAGFQSP